VTLKGSIVKDITTIPKKIIEGICQVSKNALHEMLQWYNPWPRCS